MPDTESSNIGDSSAIRYSFDNPDPVNLIMSVQPHYLFTFSE